MTPAPAPAVPRVMTPTTPFPAAPPSRVVAPVTPSPTARADLSPSAFPVREVPGAVGVSPVAIVDPAAIRAFSTLEAAAAVARVGVDANGVVDHIVGGSPLHPVYYVVPIRMNGTGAPPLTSSAPGGPQSQKVWVRTE